MGVELGTFVMIIIGWLILIGVKVVGNNNDDDGGGGDGVVVGWGVLWLGWLVGFWLNNSPPHERGV
jgi:hypothetical protein